MAPHLLDAADLAAQIGKSADYWLRRARRKEIPHVRIGRTIRFTAEHIARIVADATVEPAIPTTASTASTTAYTDPLASLSSRSSRKARP